MKKKDLVDSLYKKDDDRTTNDTTGTANTTTQSVASGNRQSIPTLNVGRTYTVKYGEKKYTLSQGEVDWVKNRYKSAWGEYYGMDDADQQRKASGVMPVSFQNNYSDSRLDKQLYELGLPSINYLESYLEQYSGWATGGISDVYGKNVSDQEWDYISDTYKKSWTYEDTVEDQNRKRQGLVPSAMLSDYTDTQIDEELLARGLPSSSKLADYSEVASRRSGIENLYGNVAFSWMNYETQGIKNDDTLYVMGEDGKYRKYNKDTDADVEAKTGSDIYTDAFFDTLETGDYSTISGLFLNNHYSETDAEEEDDYVTARGLAIAGKNKDDKTQEKYDSYSAFSYDNFVEQYNDVYRPLYASQALDGTDMTVGEFVDEVNAEIQHNERKAEYENISSKKEARAFVREFVSNNPTATASDIITEAVSFGIPNRFVRAMKNELKSGMTREEKNALEATFSELYKQEEESESKAESLDNGDNAYAYAYDNTIGMGVLTPEGVAGVFTAMYDAGYSDKAVKKARNKLITELNSPSSSAAVDSFSNKYDLSLDEVSDIRAAIDEVSKTKSNKGENAAFQAYVDEYQQTDETGMSREDAYNTAKAAIEAAYAAGSLTPDALIGIVKDSLGDASSATVRAVMSDLGFVNTSTDKMLAETDARATSRNANDDAAYEPTRHPRSGRVTNETEASKYASNWTNKDAYNFVSMLDEYTTAKNDAWLNEVADSYIDEQIAAGVPILDAYNTVSRQEGWKNGLKENDEYYTQKYFTDVLFPESIEASNDAAVKAAWDETDDATKAETALEVWNSLSEEERSGYSLYGNRLLNTQINKTGTEQAFWQISGKLARTFASITSGTVGFADMVAHIFTPNQYDENGNAVDTRWQLTKDLAEAEAVYSTVGVAKNQSIASDALNTGTTVASEILRMYIDGFVGGGLASIGGLATKASAEGASRLLQFAARAAQSSPFVMEAMGSYYGEYMQAGGTQSGALAYGVVLGALEGGLEAVQFDSFYGKALGASKFGKMLVDGGKAVKTASVVNKARLVTLLASSVGEFTEESISYFASTAWNSHLTGNKITVDDWLEQGGMGALTGLFGSAISVSNINSTSLQYDYLAKKGWNNSTIDMLTAATWAAGQDPSYISEKANGANIKSAKDYRNLVVQLHNAESGETNAVNTYNKTVARENKKISDIQSQLDKELAAMSGIDINSSRVTAAQKAQWGEAAGCVAALRNQLVAAQESAMQTIQSAAEVRDTAITNSRTQAQSLAEQVDEHWAGMYLLFKDDIDAFTAASESQKAAILLEAEQARLGTALDSAYSDNAAQYEAAVAKRDAILAQMKNASADEVLSLTDELEKAESEISQLNVDINAINEQLASTYSPLDSASETVASADSLLNALYERMSRVRNNGAFYDAKTAAEEKAKTAAEAEAKTSAEPKQSSNESEEQKPDAKNNASKGNVVRDFHAKKDDIDRVKASAAVLGVRVQFFREENTTNNGFKDEKGVLHVNTFQYANDSDNFFEQPLFVIFKHEMGHLIETSSLYEAFSDFVEVRLSQMYSDFDLKATLDDIIAKRAKDGETLDDARAKAELVSTFVSKKLFNDAQSIRMLARENRGLFGRLFNSIQYVIAKGKLRGQDSADAKAMLQAERLFAQAFADSQRIARKASATKSGVNTRNSFGSSSLADVIQRRNVPEATYNAMVALNDEYMSAVREVEAGTRDESDLMQYVSKMAKLALPDNMAIDEDGNAVGLFHGTQKGLPNELDDGVLFSSNNKETALDYTAQGYDPVVDVNLMKTGGKTGVLSQIFNMQNPYVIDCNQDSWDAIGRNASDLTAANLFFTYNKDANTLIVQVKDSDGMPLTNDTHINLSAIDEDTVLNDDSTNKERAETYAFQCLYETNAPFAPKFSDGDSVKSQNTALFDEELRKQFEDAITAVMFNGESESSIAVEWDDLFGELYLGQVHSTDAYVAAAKELMNDPTVDSDYKYDGVIFKNVVDGGKAYSDVYVSLDPAFNVKSFDPITRDDSGDVIPLIDRFDVSKKDIRYSSGDYSLESIIKTGEPLFSRSNESLDELIRTYGTIDKGRSPRRDIDIAARTSDTSITDRAVRSALEYEPLSQDKIDGVIAALGIDEYGTHETQKDADLLERGKRVIEENGIEKAIARFREDADKTRIAAENMALGQQIIAAMAEHGDSKLFQEFFADYAMASVETGRGVQIQAALKDLDSGSVDAIYLDKMVEKINKKNEKKIYKGKASKVVVPSSAKSDLINAKTPEERRRATERITKAIGKQLPPSFMDKLSSWRYFSMLANPVTHARNMLGNLAMAGMRSAKDVVAAGYENIAVRTGLMNTEDRTHSVYVAANHPNEIAYAKKIFEEKSDIIASSSKQTMMSVVEQNRDMFDIDVINWLSKTNFRFMEAEDIIALRPAFVSAMTQYIVSKNWSIDTMSKLQKKQAFEYAALEAQRATFRDASAVAKLINNAAHMNIPARIFIEGLMPFKKTTVNIAKRGFDYSPFGLMRGIVNGCINIASTSKNGKTVVPAAKVVDQLAMGTVGTSLMAVGALLAKLGILKGSGDKDERYEKYLRDRGYQSYSIDLEFLGIDASVNISQIAPATIPLFMGVDLYNGVMFADGEFNFDALVNAAASAFNPLMEMSFLASINDALTSYGNEGIGGNIGAVLGQAAKSYGSQYLPTLGGKISNFTNQTLRTAKGSSDFFAGSGMDYWWRSNAKKIPGLSKVLQPDINMSGEETQKTTFGDWALDFANNFILPTTVKVRNKDVIDDEIMSVFEQTGESSIVPNDPQNYFMVSGNKYEMSASEYADYSRDRGQAVYAALKELMKKKSYLNGDAEEKAEMISKAIKKSQDTVATQYKEKFGLLD